MLHLTDPGFHEVPTRRGLASPEGPVHLVMFHTHDHRPHFADAAAASMATQALRAAEQAGPSRLLAWVLMPDGWQGLVELTPRESLPCFVDRIKNAMARELRDKDAEGDRIWSPASQDHLLRNVSILRDCARHLVMGPVRAGLVDRPADYPFWDAIWFAPPRRPSLEESARRDVPELMWEPL